jgi:hypothetical protein
MHVAAQQAQAKTKRKYNTATLGRAWVRMQWGVFEYSMPEA